MNNREIYPRFPLLWGPTPLHPLPRLAERVGVGELWVKRDDLTGVALGGNKVRKLEFLLGEAKEAGCDLVITGGSPQSNHARLTAGAARQAGMDAWLVFAGDRFGKEQGNLLLDRLTGARCFLSGVYGSSALLEAMEEKAREAAASGRRPFVVPVGGSTVRGDYGYVLAAEECADQMTEQNLPPFDRVVLAVGSGGTLAGLLVGKYRFPGWAEQILGVSVWMKQADVARVVFQLAANLTQVLGMDDIPQAEIHVTDDQVGRGYGRPTEEGKRAIRLLAETEGLFVDPVYSGKALAGLIDQAEQEDWSDKRVLFWHTGGAPGLFTHASALLD
ncbi:1-aminocyclopropane-1-carboxylate deaminase/D-cysteine desulfhydrase [Desmospora profundinema]|uniref:D-cysteine desulfhydrase family pyridoxal phosphate-dependent enzyme n=1 Tax=Desmospora profundinema TaxID=1571184 RepID=A0ABU1II83_9BACL|nr:D-cysteine desulfhydrase family protein [Desmospora profundinema]MDR6224477.1 D-cysteine desulfhydrase family pyridoxal phosphate-dependent enzyme [Desmospora profundinema]